MRDVPSRSAPFVGGDSWGVVVHGAAGIGGADVVRPQKRTGPPKRAWGMRGAQPTGVESPVVVRQAFAAFRRLTS